MNLIFNLEPAPRSGSESFNLFTTEEWMACRGMHSQIWETFVTPPCAHEYEAIPKTPMNLGPEALALLAWRNVREAQSMQDP